MSDSVNRPRRGYHSPRRAEQAAGTRHAILAAARALFTTKGYVATTVADIAAEAGVAVDTVYTTVGRKPVVLREVVEAAISGTDHAVPAEKRDYVAQIRAATTAAEKLDVYADAVARIQQRLGPVYLALRDAATVAPDCAKLWAEISQRRAVNMRLFAADLQHTGQVRADLSADEIADLIWSMNGPEYWALLVHDRGWTPHRYGRWLADAWKRLLLPAPATDQAPTPPP